MIATSKAGATRRSPTSAILRRRMAKRRTSGIQRRERASTEAMTRRIDDPAGLALPDWRLLAIGGVLGALGNAGIPPGGLVTYLLLPFWLVAASIIVSKRQRTETRMLAGPGRPDA